MTIGTRGARLIDAVVRPQGTSHIQAQPSKAIPIGPTAAQRMTKAQINSRRRVDIEEKHSMRAIGQPVLGPRPGAMFQPLSTHSPTLYPALHGPAYRGGARSLHRPIHHPTHRPIHHAMNRRRSSSTHYSTYHSTHY
jgi:hypothetical protein